MKKGSKQSPEALEKMRQAKLGKKMSIGTREKMRASQLKPETLEANRQAHLGKKDSTETIEKKRASHLGEKNAFFGKHHSKETLDKMTGRPKTELHCQHLSEVKKGITPPNIGILKISRKGSQNSESHRLNQKEALANPDVKERMSITHIGEKNPNWNGGTSFLPYCNKFNARRTRAVRKFCGYVCLTCGKLESNNIVAGKQQSLSVHHIDHDKEQGCSGKPFNLVPLCASCHGYELHNQEDYRKKINAILDNNFASGIWSREAYERDVMYPE